ncbi:MAG TPA: helix-turn-helix domain-containing protein [Edaphobacter sp.]|nr:helix-turn-helix domain-containing protein [Edaphobacter sp.]
MKVCDLAELLGVDDKHIYRMAARGQLPSFRVGSAVRFDPQELAKWLRSKYPVGLPAPNVLLVERLPARFPVIERALLSQDELGWRL